MPISFDRQIFFAAATAHIGILVDLVTILVAAKLLAEIFAQLGEGEKAFEWLESANQECCPG